MRDLFKKLAEIADELDLKGLHAEASMIDDILKEAQEPVALDMTVPYPPWRHPAGGGLGGLERTSPSEVQRRERQQERERLVQKLRQPTRQETGRRKMQQLRQKIRQMFPGMSVKQVLNKFYPEGVPKGMTGRQLYTELKNKVVPEATPVVQPEQGVAGAGKAKSETPTQDNWTEAKAQHMASNIRQKAIKAGLSPLDPRISNTFLAKKILSGMTPEQILQQLR